MMRNLAFAIAIFSTGAALASPSPPELVARVLGGYEHAVTADDVKRLGADADHQLIAAAEDARLSHHLRRRAILALRFAPSADARAYLHAILDEKRRSPKPDQDGADAIDLAAAITALQPYGAEEAPLVLAFVAHASADVRQSAAVTLGAIGEPSARAALRARLAVERDASVKASLTRALEALARPR